jgi:hypothetical protein
MPIAFTLILAALVLLGLFKAWRDGESDTEF